MTEPRRWLDDEANAPPGVRELLAQAHRTAPIDRRALSISALLIAKIAATPTAAAALPLVAKLAASLAMVTVASAVAVQIAMPTRSDTASAGARKPQTATHTHARARRDRVDPEVIAAAPELAQVAVLNADAPQTAETAPSIAESVPVAAVKLRAASATRSATRHATVNAAPPPVVAAPLPLPEASETVAPVPADPLALEVQWLDAARGLLDHDPASALAQAQAHAMRFPNGALAAERELIAIDALHRLGRQAEAQSRAKAVLLRFPGSLYRERLRSLLQATR